MPRTGGKVRVFSFFGENTAPVPFVQLRWDRTASLVPSTFLLPMRLTDSEMDAIIPDPMTVQSAVFQTLGDLEDRVETAWRSPSSSCASTPTVSTASTPASSPRFGRRAATLSASSSSSSMDIKADAVSPDDVSVRLAVSSLRSILFNWADGTLTNTAACVLISDLRNDLRRDLHLSDDMTVTKCLLFVREACAAISRTISNSSLDTYTALFPHKVRSPVPLDAHHVGQPKKAGSTGSRRRLLG